MEEYDLTLTASDQEEADIRTIHLLRGAIITAYSQVEFLLADLYFRARHLQEYSYLPNKFPYKLEAKLKRLKSIADLPGPIEQFRQELHAAVDGILQLEKIRHFMDHGILIDRKQETGKNQISFRGYVEINGERMMEFLNGDLRDLNNSLNIIETYTMKFVLLAHKIIQHCKLPQVG